jgi:hypothetical protein
MFIDNTTPLGQLFIQGFYDSGVNELVSPATNTTGLIVRTLGVGGSSAPSLPVAIFADTAAPSSVSDYSKRILFCANAATDEPNYLEAPMAVQSGCGLWYVVSGSDQTADIIITYDLVSL